MTSLPPSSFNTAAVRTEQEEVDKFRCPDCGTAVPVQNKTLHSLRCKNRGNNKKDDEGGLRPRHVGWERLRGSLSVAHRGPEENDGGNGGGSSRGVEEGDSDDRVDVDDVVGVGADIGEITTEAKAKKSREADIDSGKDDIVAIGSQDDNDANGDTTDTNEQPLPSSHSGSSSSHHQRQQGGRQNGENTDTRMMCQFCNLKYPLWQIVDHSEACGSRTDICRNCNHYVRLKDMWRHRESGCQVAVTGPASNHYSSNSPPHHYYSNNSTHSAHQGQGDARGGAAAAAEGEDYMEGVRREFRNWQEGETPDPERLIALGRSAASRMRDRFDGLPQQTRRAVGYAAAATAAVAALGILYRR